MAQRMTHANKNTGGKEYTYRDAGVDIARGNELVEKIKPLAAATARPGTKGTLGGFGGLFDLAQAGIADPVLVAATDGVGTKLKIASAVDHHDGIGIDLVAMCVNDLIVQGAEPLFFLDYFASGKLKLETATRILSSIADGCIEAGCALIGGETAEMPGHYATGDYDLAGFAVGAVSRDAMLPRDDIAVGDKIFGLSSNGLHANGFSLVRAVVEDRQLDYSKSAPFAREQPLGIALLAPTRLYVKPLLAALKGAGAIKALAHITGGGLIENIPRALPGKLAAEINLDAITPHRVFAWLQREGAISTGEMLRTFNCGIGMAMIGDDKAADELDAAGETIVEIGRVIERARDAPQVVFLGDLSF